MTAAAFEVDAAFTIGAETFPVFTVFRPVVFMGKSYTARSEGDARNWAENQRDFIDILETKQRYSACSRSAISALPFVSVVSPNAFTFLLELINDCD